MAITFDRQVSASADDAVRRLVTDWFSTTIIYLDVGDLNFAVPYDYRIGLRFRNVTIPHGATIVTAYITVKARWLTGTIPTVTIEGEEAVDAAAFSTAGDFDGRPRIGSVAWTPAAWVLDTWYVSPEIASIIQAIIDQPSWPTGGDLALFLVEPDGWGGIKHITMYAWDDDPDNAAWIHVEYEIPKSGDVVHAMTSFGLL